MRLYGLLGAELSHSISPEIHGFLFRLLHIEASYLLFPVPPEKLRQAVESLKLLGAGGVNVTIPYKVQVMPMLDELSTEARKLGAVNTILFREGRTCGYNTDYSGFGRMLQRHGITVDGKTAVILGTGGAARTAAHWLLDHGATEVSLVSRTAGITGDFPSLSYEELRLLPQTDILVNATPVGMFPHMEETPLDQSVVARFSTVIDLIYNPQETRLVREARLLGLKAVNGLFMLAAQAVAAEEIWQGRNLSQTMEPTCNFLSELPEHSHNLVFIGMPGSGKSTLGQLTADRLGWEFCDTDPFIEQRAGRSISEIFRLEGEEAFRRLETEAIREFSNRRRVVIATGGGAVTRPENMAMLRATGSLIYLDRPIEMIAAAGLRGRPLLAGDSGKLYSLFAERKHLYERYAGCRITNAQPPDRVVDTIIARLKGREKGYEISAH